MAISYESLKIALKLMKKYHGCHEFIGFSFPVIRVAVNLMCESPVGFRGHLLGDLGRPWDSFVRYITHI